MFTVYALKSLKNNKRYVGFTSKQIEKRLSWHEWGLTAWTRQNGPFELLYAEEHKSKSFAQKREKYFKTGQGRRTLDILIAEKGSSISAIKHGGPAKKFGGG